MAKNNYDILEGQIGDFGDEGSENKSGMGKLKHKAAYGQKEDLGAQEQSEMDAFLERSRKHNVKQQEQVSISEGWIPIDKEEMGDRAMFYPSEWEFMIRPATVMAIKNWTAIDEERPDVVNNVFNDIIKSCVKIDTHGNGSASWGAINSWDRFWFILKVREYSRAVNQDIIEFSDECSECNEEVTYALRSENLFYEYPDEDIIEKYWDGATWTINPQEYDVDHSPIKLYTPTIGKDEAIINWASAKIHASGKIDETFIKFLVWLLPKAPKDNNMLDRQISQIQKQYKQWDIDMFTFMTDVINNISVNMSEKLRMTCPHCGREATSTVQFPDGIKVLFEVKSTAKKFGSR